MYDIFPLLLIFPYTLSISPNKADKNVDFPDPTLPIIDINSPWLILSLSTSKGYLF